MKTIIKEINTAKKKFRRAVISVWVVKLIRI